MSMLKAVLAILFIVLNTLLWSFLLYPFALLKILVPAKNFRHRFSQVILFCAENWIRCNTAALALLYDIHWSLEGLENLSTERSYLVIANHQSWVDITVLQHVFRGRIPFLRFFLKQELIYIPLLNGAWWALDFPFMKRYSKDYLDRHPEKRGEDLATTRRACERFRGQPISVLNFLEGTRFTVQKQQKQNSPYQHLLRPKVGGIAFVLEAMGEQFHSLLDVSITYPEGSLSMWEFLRGHLHEVKVRVRELPIPKDLLHGNYMENEIFRRKFQNWVQEIWESKDSNLSEMNS